MERRRNLPLGSRRICLRRQGPGIGVTWANPIVRLEKINGGFAYSLNREHFDVSSIFATALGGTVHGKLDASRLPGSPALGRIGLEVTGIELEQALRAFSTRELPLERLPLSGLTAGTLKVNWRGSLLDARMDGDLRVRPVLRAGTLPVTAVVQATVDFKDESVEVQSVDASTQATHLTTQGGCRRTRTCSWIWRPGNWRNCGRW